MQTMVTIETCCHGRVYWRAGRHGSHRLSGSPLHYHGNHGHVTWNTNTSVTIETVLLPWFLLETHCQGRVYWTAGRHGSLLLSGSPLHYHGTHVRVAWGNKKWKCLKYSFNYEMVSHLIIHHLFLIANLLIAIAIWWFPHIYVYYLEICI